MMKAIEVEIRRPFDDPEKRITAMYVYAEMLDWLQLNSEGNPCVMCQIDGNEIVWKFGGRWGSNDKIASAFDLLFDNPVT